MHISIFIYFHSGLNNIASQESVDVDDSEQDELESISSEVRIIS